MLCITNAGELFNIIFVRMSVEIRMALLKWNKGVRKVSRADMGALVSSKPKQLKGDLKLTQFATQKPICSL